jgi:hypothetical protein
MKSHNAHSLGFSELQRDVALFYRWRDVIEVREMYRPFACPKCKTLDRRKALTAVGVDPDFGRRVKNLKLDAFSPRDLQDVAARPLFNALDNRFPGVLRAVPVPGTRYVVILPKRPVELPLHADKPGRASEFGASHPVCPACGRFPGMTIKDANIRLPAGKHLMGVVWTDESYHVPVTSWVADDVVRDALGKRWRGVGFTRGMYGPKAPFYERAKRVREAQTPENNMWLKLLQDSGQLKPRRAKTARKSKG